MEIPPNIQLTGLCRLFIDGVWAASDEPIKYSNSQHITQANQLTIIELMSAYCHAFQCHARIVPRTGTFQLNETLTICICAC